MDDDSSTSMKRRLAAILAADISGYSRLMGEDEAATVRDLKGHQAVILPLVGRYGGRIIDTAGDGILAEFPSVINAAECAVEIQTIMATRNEGVSESRRMRFRIGINLGDVIHDATRIYGNGINIARPPCSRHPPAAPRPSRIPPHRWQGRGWRRRCPPVCRSGPGGAAPAGAGASSDL